MKSPDDWAREFKLHHCVGHKGFAAQVNKIRNEALDEAIKIVNNCANNWRGGHYNTNDTCGTINKLIKKAKQDENS